MCSEIVRWSYVNEEVETVLLRVAATHLYRARDLLGAPERTHISRLPIHTSCASGNVGARARPSETAERHAGCGCVKWARGIVRRDRGGGGARGLGSNYSERLLRRYLRRFHARSVGVAGRKLNERVRASLSRLSDDLCGFRGSFPGARDFRPSWWLMASWISTRSSSQSSLPADEMTAYREEFDDFTRFSSSSCELYLKSSGIKELSRFKANRLRLSNG